MYWCVLHFQLLSLLLLSFWEGRLVYSVLTDRTNVQHLETRCYYSFNSIHNQSQTKTILQIIFETFFSNILIQDSKRFYGTLFEFKILQILATVFLVKIIITFTLVKRLVWIAFFFHLHFIELNWSFLIFGHAIVYFW